MPNFQSDNMDRLPQEQMNLHYLSEDSLMEEILTNINSTPIGQVLKRMASLPEIRRGKVLRLRQQITEGSYDEGERLDAALDRVLEDLTA